MDFVVLANPKGRHQPAKTETIFLAMKLTAILLFIACIKVQAGGYAQGITLSEKDAPLEKVFRAIEKQTGYHFMYRDEWIRGEGTINIDVKNASLNKVLELCFKGRPLTYTIIDRLIVVSQRKEPDNETDLPPPVDVKGRLLNENGEPVAGASVMVKGTRQGTTTDDQGYFELKNVNDDAVIMVSGVNIQSTEWPLNGRTELRLVAKIKVGESESVTVLSTGYQAISRGRATGSYSIVTNEELSRLSGTDFRTRLEGLVPGLTLGRSQNLMIRGQGTFSAGTAPLVVVDGIPIENADYKLNPDDIEQISVLKDAAAASIWGIRSANGVIVITTKKGTRNGTTAISYNNFISIEERVDLADLHQLSTDKYVTGEWNKYLQFGTGFLQPWSFVTEVGEIYNQLQDDQDTAAALAKVNMLAGIRNQAELEKLFYRNALVNNHTISVRTGNEKLSHYLSLNYSGDMAALEGNQTDKLNFVSNSEFGISSKIKLNLGTRGNFSKLKFNGEEVAFIKPYIRMLNANGDYINEHQGVAQEYKDLLEENGWKDWSFNRYQELQNNDFTAERNNYAVNLQFHFEPITGLKYSLQGSFEKGFNRSSNYYSPFSYYTRDLVNKFTENANAQNPSIVDYHIPRNGGILSTNNSDYQTLDLRNQLSYSRQVGDLGIHALGGTELYGYTSAGEYDLYMGYNPQTLVSTEVDRMELQNGVTGYNAVAGNTRFNQDFANISETIERYVSVYGTLSLNYLGRYDFFASARQDRTNLLVNADKYRNNPSWSAGGRWSLSREKFFNVPWVNNLAWKASYGVSGNIDKSTAPDLVASAGVSSIGLPILYITNPENKELGWEKTYVFNTGLEFSLFDRRWQGSLEFYHKDGRELLYNVTLDPTTGWANIKKNAASIMNRGIELNLQGRVLNVGDFNWNIGLVFAHNYNEVRKVDYTPTQNDILGFGSPIVGQPLNYLPVIPYLGIDNQGNPLIQTSNGKDTLGASDLRDFTLDDYRYAGRKDPPFFGSFTTDFSYQRFRLNMFFTYRLGHKFLLPAFQNSIGNSAVNEWSDPALTWQEPGDELVKPYPKLVNGFYVTDVAYIVNHKHTLVDKADLIRLRSLSLSYDLGQFAGRGIFKGGSIRLSGENLWYWAANKYNLDTDYIAHAASTSTTSIQLPARRKFVLFLELNF